MPAGSQHPDFAVAVVKRTKRVKKVSVKCRVTTVYAGSMVQCVECSLAAATLPEVLDFTLLAIPQSLQWCTGSSSNCFKSSK